MDMGDGPAAVYLFETQRFPPIDIQIPSIFCVGCHMVKAMTEGQVVAGLDGQVGYLVMNGTVEEPDIGGEGGGSAFDVLIPDGVAAVMDQFADNFCRDGRCLFGHR